MSFWASEMSDLAVNNSASHLTNEERLYLRIYLEKKYKSITITRILLAEFNLSGFSLIYIRISKSRLVIKIF